MITQDTPIMDPMESNDFICASSQLSLGDFQGSNIPMDWPTHNTIDPSRSVTSCAPKPKPSSAAKVKVVHPKTKNKAAPPAKPAPEEPKKRGNPKSEVAPAPTPKRSRRGRSWEFLEAVSALH